jgi:hypothetical protein
MPPTNATRSLSSAQTLAERKARKSSFNNRAVLSGTADQITVTRRNKNGEALELRVGPHNVSLSGVADQDLVPLCDFIHTGKPDGLTLQNWGRMVRRFSYFVEYLHAQDQSLARFFNLDSTTLQGHVREFAMNDDTPAKVGDKEVLRSLEQWFSWKSSGASARRSATAYLSGPVITIRPNEPQTEHVVPIIPQQDALPLAANAGKPGALVNQPAQQWGSDAILNQSGGDVTLDHLARAQAKLENKADR